MIVKFRLKNECNAKRETQRERYNTERYKALGELNKIRIPSPLNLNAAREEISCRKRSYLIPK